MGTFIKNIFIFLSAAILAWVTGCGIKNQQRTMSEQTNSSIFPKGEPLPASYFTGNAFVYILASRDKTTSSRSVA